MSATDDTEATEDRTVTLTLNVEEAAEVHGHADDAAAAYAAMAKRMEAVPQMARFFQKGADLNAGIADRIEADFPEFALLPERNK